MTIPAIVTEQALLEYAQQTIRERAAIPKEMYLLDQMPLTAVGKIFKVPLRCDAVRRVYTEVLATIIPACVSFEVSVEPDQRYGMLATLVLSGMPDKQHAQLEEQIAQVLSAYVVKFQTRWN